MAAITYAVQVNGKMRGTIDMPVDAAKDTVIGAAKALESVSRLLDGKTIRREIFVPKRLVNIVAN